MQATTHAQIRILKTCLETRMRQHLVMSMALWLWLARHSAWLVERFQMRPNGRTAFEDCYGTRYSGIVLRFGEVCVFRHPVGTAKSRTEKTAKQLRKDKANNNMDLGVWAGKTYDTDQHLVGSSDGVFTARTVRRVAAEQQWQVDMMVAVTGLPWNMEAGRLI